MYYLIDDDPDLRYDDIDEAIEHCIPDDYFDNDTDGFDEYLDSECEVRINGNDFDASKVLYQMDQELYYSDLRDWACDEVESRRSDAKYDLQRTEDGDFCWIEGYKVYVYDDEDEEEYPYGDVKFDNLDALEALEAVAEAARLAEEQQEAEEKSADDDFMKLIQII